MPRRSGLDHNRVGSRKRSTKTSVALSERQETPEFQDLFRRPELPAAQPVVLTSLSSDGSDEEEPAVTQNRRKTHIIPETVRFLVHKTMPGWPAKRIESQNLFIAGYRTLSYAEIIEKLDCLEDQWGMGTTRGRWSIVRQIQMSRARKPASNPTGRFTCEDDWKVNLSDFEKESELTGADLIFVVKNTYMVITTQTPASNPILRPGTATPTRERPTSERSSTQASLGPQSTIEDDHDSVFDDAFGIPDTQPDPDPEFTPTPAPRETTTSRREALLPQTDRRLSEKICKIQKEHKCDTCGNQWCYNPMPMPGRKHCQISPGSASAWGLCCLQGTATTHRPPATCKEWIQWQKDLANKLKGTPSQPGASSGNGAAHVHIHINKNGEIPPNNENIQAAPPASSPLNSDDDECMLLKSWFYFTVRRHASLARLDNAESWHTIEGALEKQDMGYWSVKDYLESSLPERWAELQSYGFTHGLARWMHCDHSSWKKSEKPVRMNP